MFWRKILHKTAAPASSLQAPAPRYDTWLRAFHLQRRDAMTSADEKRRVALSKHVVIPPRQRVPNYVGKRDRQERTKPTHVFRPNKNKLYPNYVGKRQTLESITNRWPFCRHNIIRTASCSNSTSGRTVTSTIPHFVGHMDNVYHHQPLGSHDLSLARDSILDHMSKRRRFIGKRSASSSDENGVDRRHVFVGKRGDGGGSE